MDQEEPVSEHVVEQRKCGGGFRERSCNSSRKTRRHCVLECSARAAESGEEKASALTTKGIPGPDRALPPALLSRVDVGHHRCIGFGEDRYGSDADIRISEGTYDRPTAGNGGSPSTNGSSEARHGCFVLAVSA